MSTTTQPTTKARTYTQAEVDALLAAQKPTRRMTIKVSEKGACSVYGMGQWPVTLYKSQWAVLIPMIPEIQKFLKDNDSKLTEKAK